MKSFIRVFFVVGTLAAFCDYGNAQIALPSAHKIAPPTSIITLEQFNKSYTQAPDKLKFLLENANSEDNHILSFIARELSNYSGSQVVETLTRLSQIEEHIRPDYATFVASNALESLAKINAAPDLKSLETPLDPVKREQIVQKYYLSERTSIRENLLSILLRKTPTDPVIYVPLLVHYFTSIPSAQAMIVKYPDSAVKAMDRTLKSNLEWRKAGVVGLARQLKLESYLPKIAQLLPYPPEQDSYSEEGLRLQLEHFFLDFDDKSLPYLELPLYSGNYTTQERVIYILHRIAFEGSPLAREGALSLLREFQQSLNAEMPDKNFTSDSPSDYEARVRYTNLRELLKIVIQQAERQNPH